jgi:hypothetical protein
VTRIVFENPNVPIITHEEETWKCIKIQSANRTYAQSGANPTIVSFIASTVQIYNAKSSLVCFWKQKYFLLHTLKNAPAFYNAGVVCSCKFRSRRIGSWSCLMEEKLLERNHSNGIQNQVGSLGNCHRHVTRRKSFTIPLNRRDRCHALVLTANRIKMLWNLSKHFTKQKTK